MKLNFWQWLGIILLVLGIAYYIYENNFAKSEAKPGPTTTSNAR